MTEAIRSSRLWALTRLSPTRFLFPHRMTLSADGVATSKVRFLLLPWVCTDEHAAFGRLSSVVHDKGVVWDTVIVETSGGSNNLDIRGVAKGAARAFVAAVQERLNAT
ncbi:MAG: hypothetical protein FJX36_04250 [Alphaproteobacteria bacterium]|nr:hypothetical protein [Alphaproteobacteria bacterium]